MKRRSFIGMIGAAFAVPAIPFAAPSVGYSRATYGMAVLHARTRAHVSARGLAFCLKVSVPQAEAMVAEMARGGLVRPIAGGSMRAVSNILNPGVWGTVASQSVKVTEPQQPKGAMSCGGTSELQNDLSLMLAHLQNICRARGMTVVA